MHGTNGLTLGLGAAKMERRHFPATVMAGRLYLDGPGFAYWTESQVDAVFNPRVGSRKIETGEELERAIRAVGGFPSVRIWIAEGLEGVARSRSTV